MREFDIKTSWTLSMQIENSPDNPGAKTNSNLNLDALFGIFPAFEFRTCCNDEAAITLFLWERKRGEFDVQENRLLYERFQKNNRSAMNFLLTYFPTRCLSQPIQESLFSVFVRDLCSLIVERQ